MNPEEFFTQSRGLVVAPAGFRKTYFIADAFKHVTGKHLILTHTHAGVASIKAKLSNQKISKERFQVETIFSLAQRFVLSFYTGSDLPEQDDKKHYFPFVIRKAADLLARQHISRIISESYNGLFVDEYQDCTLSQHDFIKQLSGLLPTYLLGDYLQGIFGFNGEELVDLECPIQMGGFIENRFELTEPNRWIHNGNPKLGDAIKDIRRSLEKSQAIDLSQWSTIRTILCESESDIYKPETQAYQALDHLKKAEKVLVIHPNSGAIASRKTFVNKSGGGFHLLESIDEPEFYEIAKLADETTSTSIIDSSAKVLVKLFAPSNVEKCIKNGKLCGKNSKKEDTVREYNDLKLIFDGFDPNRPAQFFELCIGYFGTHRRFPCDRKELMWSFQAVCEYIDEHEISFFEAMKLHRNKVRRIGRKLRDRCIGTTLLTKGLEFDTVAVLHAHKFECPKHFYVAISRARKNLVVFTTNAVLSPYKIV